jgi:hypothetical protein
VLEEAAMTVLDEASVARNSGGDIL